MISSLLPQAASVVLGGAVLIAGVAAALNAASVVKRLTGALVAILGAMLGAGALGAPAELITAAAAIMISYCALGAALIVRLQESYATSQSAEIDAADDQMDSEEVGG